MTPLTVASVFALLLTTTLSSWVPVAPSLPQFNEPRWQKLVQPRTQNTTDEWPYGPLKTEGRNIVNTKGDVESWAGVNWPMSGKLHVA
jgi:endoglucanase